MSDTSVFTRPRRQALVVASAVALVGVVLGLSIARGRWALPTALVAVMATLLLSATSWAAYGTLLAAASSVAWVYAYPQLDLGPVGIFASEVVLLAGFGAVVWRAGSARELGVPAFTLVDWAFVGFALAVGGGVAVGTFYGLDVKTAVLAARPMVFYLGFALARSGFEEPLGRQRLLRLGALVVVAVVVLQVLQVMVGQETRLFFIGSFGGLVSEDPASGFLRVRPPGLTLAYVGAIFSACYLLWGPRRRLWVAGAVMVAAVSGVLLSFNRNMVVGLVVGSMVAGLVAKRRSRLLVASAVLLITLSVAYGFAGPSLSDALSSSPVLHRVLSLADPSGEGVRSTLSDRAYENAFALKALAANPLFGLGWGVPYGALVTSARDGELVTSERQWIHNQYLSIWLRTGLAGVMCLLLMLGAAADAAARWSRHPQAGDSQWLGPAVCGSLAALALSATVGLYWSSPDSIVVLVGVVALGAQLRNERRALVA